jgi:CheY-like chemotaxis protein
MKRVVRHDPPDAVVIDLARLPSHGREVAGILRQQTATHHLPIVFIEGDPDKTRRPRP